MYDPEIEVLELSLSPATEIPEAIIGIIKNSFVFSIDELNIAKQRRKTMYLCSDSKGEYIGYCIALMGFQFEVAEELVSDIDGMVLWIDVFEIAVQYQGNDYGRFFFEQIRSRCSYDMLLMSIEDSICFWQALGFTVVSYSGEMAYMICER